MTAVLTELFEGGTNGAQLSAGNTAFTNFGGTATNRTFSTAEHHTGSLSGHFTGTSTTFATALYDPAGVVTTAYWSLYVKPVALPTTTWVLMQVGNRVAGTFTRTFQVAVNSGTGLVKVQNTGGTAVFTTTSGLVVGEWNRIDVSCVSGTVSLAFYPGNATCDNAVGTATAGNFGSGAAGATAIQERQYGITANCVIDCYLDSVRENDAVLPGPVGGTAPTVNAGPDLTKDVGSSAFTITGISTPVAPATIVSRSWAQISGPTVGLANSTSATVTVTPPATSTGTAVLRFTATDNNGLSASDDVSITFVTAGQTYRPVGDVAVASWTATPASTPLSGDIDELVADPADYLLSPDTPTGQEYKFRLESKPPPGSTTGVILELMLNVTAGVTSHSVVCKLYESDGTTLRKSVTITDLTTTPTIRQIALTSGEAAAITSWASGLVVGVAATAS